MQVEAEQDGDLRRLFPDRPFTGTDFRSGPGVDRVEDLRSLSYEDGTVGTALCIDTLEHCEDPPLACRELTRVVADGGVCLISSVMLFGIHAYPNDYFRFTPQGFEAMLSGFDDTWVCGVGHPDIPSQVIGVGAKGRTLDFSREMFPSLRAAQAEFDAARGRVRLGVHNYRPRVILGAFARQLPRLVSERLASGGGR